MVIDGECESPFFTSASLFEDIGGLRMRLRRGCDYCSCDDPSDRVFCVGRPVGRPQASIDTPPARL
jgi:hypothetical protein